MTTKSGKHANKIAKNALDSAANNGVIKAVDMRKVAALSAGAAGVIAGAAIAFGATPAMAADATSAPVDTSTSANAQDLTAKKDDSKKQAGETNQNKQTEVKKQDNQTVVNADNTEGKTDKQAADSTPAPSSTPAGAPAGPNYGQVREANPAPAPKVNSTIELSQDKKDTLPNMYAWGSSDNVYIEKGQNQEVTFKFAKPSDGSTITKVAIFPSDGNTVDNTKSRKFLEYYSDAAAVNEHQPYSGTYEFKVDNDGTATLTMTKLYRDGNLKSGESYSANRCIYVYGTDKDGKTVVLYKTNIVRAATLIPPKTAGSIVLKYNEELTAQQIQDKLKAALDAPTEATGKKSIRDQITAASTSRGVGGRTGENGAFVQTPDTAENKVIITDQNAYDASQLAKINKVTSQQGQPTTYVAGAQTLKTYLISDLGYKSDVLPLTVARYDTRIDKPIVDEVDINKLTDDQKADICKKLANLNHVTQDKVTFNDKGEAVINFDGVDAADAPKIPLRDLVLKKIAEDKISVPAADKAVFVANPLGYSKAEIDRIKTAIFEANKDNKELGLTSKDQITLSYLTGDLTASGDANKGISNGQAENKITVKIKTDKSVAEFTSNVKESKLTKLPNIRTDYDVTWTKTKIDGRDTDEGISWSNDQKTTIIYRYDPTKAEEFDTNKILNLLKATPKDKQAGLRDLTGGEQLSYEGTGNNGRKSHMHYVLQDNEPTTELTLGNMGGAYWSGNQKVSNSDVDLGDNLSDAGSYSWDTEAGSVTVAAKKGKIFKARLFVEPYAMTYYKHVYLEQGRNPGNTAKAINVIFVPQTNHKTKDLSDSIGEHKTENVEGKEVPTQSKYYNASADKKDAYEKALKTATDLLATVKDKQEKDLTEEQKAQIDNATINLNKARAELDGADTNKDKLNDSIDANGKAAEGTTAATGTQATNQFKNVSDPDFKKADGSDDKDRNEAAKKAKTDYDKALEEANKVKEDKNATQKAVDDAKAKLDAAREKLNDFTTNKDELNNAIAQHGKVNTGDAKKTDPAEKLKTADPTYQNSTPEQRKAYDDAVKKANELSKDPNASQKEVNEAIKKLKDAKDALDKNATDKAPLDAAVQKSLDKDPNKHSVFYTNAKNKTGDEAAKKAVEDYDKALAEAKRVLGDKNATKADVDKAKKDLEDAEKVLYADKYSTDKTDLGKAIADNFSGYLMPAYFNAFDKAQAGDEQAKKDFKAYNDAYHAAKDLMDELNKPGSTVDQKKVDAVKEQLIAARKIIDTYATDTSRLSAAALNDFAIQHSPAYANLKELAEKQNPSEEEKAKVEAAKKAKEAYEKAAAKLTAALTNTLPKDQANGHDIPDNIIPKEDGDPNDKDYLKDIQAHKNGEPLNRDVDTILKEMNEAAKALDKFATKTDELIKSINEDATTHPSPAFKNASQPSFQKPDGSGPDDAKNAAAKAAADAYGKALNEAKDLLKKPDATQKEVNDALKKLDDARKELDKYNTDTTKLAESVKKHGSTEGPAPTEGTQTSDAYRNASDPHFLTADGKPDTDKNAKAAAAKKAYDEALTKAQELLKKHDDKATPQDAKPTQKEIDEALKTLDEARKKLEDNYKTVTTDLEKEINKSTPEGAPAVTEDDFENTPEFKNAKAKTSDGNENADVTAYKEALKKARNLVKAAADQDKKNSSHPTQKQINDALDALKAAKKQITDNYKTNLEPLTSAKDFADDGFKKTPEYKNALAKKTAGDPGATNDLGETGKDTGFDNILKKVTEKLNDEDWKKKATQKDVNALLKQLKDAQDNIAKKYKTDAIKLEREVGDKDQDGKPVTPPFEASVAYKNALEKAKTEEDKTGNDSATKKLEAYNEKLKAAQELLNKVNHPDPNAKPEDRPTQKQVDDALAALKKAKKDIDDNFKTKVDALKKETKELKDDGGAKPDTEKFEKSTEFKNASAKTDADSKKDVQTYKDALKKANDLLGKFDENGKPKSDAKDIPTQQEVDAAKKALKEIKDKILANYKTNPHDLQEEVDNSKDGDEDKRDTTFENTPEYQNATAKGDEAAQKALKDYNDKLDAARKLLGAFNRNDGKVKDKLPDGMTKAPTQKELDDALDALQAAKKKITDGYKTNPSKLKSEADKDGDFTKTPEYVNAQAKGDDASKKDLEAYKKALEDANKVLGDKNATQKQVDDALKKLQDAKSKLTDGYKTDKNKLYQEKGNDPEFRKSIPFLIADSKDIAEYNKALNDANAVLEDPNATQAQVDEALRKLQAIKQRILDFYNSLGSGSGDDSDGGSTGANNANANAVDKSMLHAEVNGALADVANGTANGAKGTKGALVDASVIKEFNDALENARRVLADPNATREQVEAATMRLRAARAALNAAKANKGSNLRGNMGVQTGVDSATLSAFAAVFVGLAGLGVSAKRRKHAR
ncbi:FIVAR domain-containing protein [Gardnerella pickettii]|uniref:M protein repeat protein n=1 Tax=Gardnerella pickettii JCP8017A TaxID=1261062 RepID=T2PIF5_9BIFI|nr:FIVAR domain-containing protein [Gardnerella pickettii]EPI49264.1 M protein repeat protein [Gardnerella pickettii JCP8017A]EPI58837.1 M protein repeat protein [Gardnerella pickettii JCP8017B]